MPLSKMALKWGFDSAGLGDIPGLDYDKMVHAVVLKLAENDITQFMGKITDVLSKWEAQQMRRFPAEYAVVRINPYALDCYSKNWPLNQLRLYTDNIGGRPNKVFGIPIEPDPRMFRTSWELQLGGKLLESGEVLEVVE
jgi:hypothetical protein